MWKSLLLLASCGCFCVVSQLCPRDGIYAEAFSRCFYFVPEAVSYSVAKAMCAAIDGHGQLVSIHSAFEESYIYAGTAKHFESNDYWIGYSDLNQPHVWEWQDGVTSLYTNWASGFPMNASNMDCGASLVSTGKWYNAFCEETEIYFICQAQPILNQSTLYPPTTTTATKTTTTTTKTATTSTTTTTTTTTTSLAMSTQSKGPPPTDSSGWMYYSGTNSWYKVMNNYLPFAEGEKACAAAGGHLVSIHSADENSFVKGLLTASDEIWIGLQSPANLPYTWTWTDGTNFDYNNWDTGYPTGANYCGTMKGDAGEWKNFGCGYYNKFMCKRPA